MVDYVIFAFAKAKTQYRQTLYYMKKRLLLVLLIACFTGCDDGDIVVEELDFADQTMQACLPDILDGSASQEYVFFKTNTASSESVVLSFSTGDPILPAAQERFSVTLGGGNRFEYRRFNKAPGNHYFCTDVPPADIRVVESLNAVSGVLFITTEARNQDDNDGVPAEVEGFTADTDGDGILDYLDSDDDGDNVPTINESPGIEENGVMNGRDHDMDGVLDYLDPDDDGDGVPTIQEDLNRDLNPLNDLNIDGTPLYLSSMDQQSAVPAIDEYRLNLFITENTVNFTFENLVLDGDATETIRENYVLGDYVTGEIQIAIRPQF